MSATVHPLPPILQQLIDTIGFDHAMALVKAYGGTRIYVPLSRTQWLNEVLDDTALRAMCQAFGGSFIDLPKQDKVIQKIRDEKIRAERSEYSLNELALRYNLTRRHVQNILRDDENAECNLDLF